MNIINLFLQIDKRFFRILSFSESVVNGFQNFVLRIGSVSQSVSRLNLGYWTEFQNPNIKSNPPPLTHDP